MKTQHVLTILAVGLLVWALRLNIDALRAQEPPAPRTTPQILLSYQARLSDPATGEPAADGLVTITFKLYDAEGSSTALWSETKAVPVQGGVFSTALGDTTPLPQDLFDGQALWLGIQVEGDAEATPRQAILPVAYALTLVPGATISAPRDVPALILASEAGGQALRAGGRVDIDGDLLVTGRLEGGTHTHNAADITSGTIPEPRLDPALSRDNEVMPTVLNNDGPGTGLDADLLDGLQAADLAPAAHTHWGQSWSGADTGLILSGGSIGLSGAGSQYGLRGISNNGVGVYGQSGLGPGLYGTSDSEAGVHGYSKDGRGVVGRSATSYGGYFSADNDHNDILLGGQIGRINTDSTFGNSNLILSSNNDVILRLDNDGGENGFFRIQNSGGTNVGTVDENGEMTLSRVRYNSPRTHYFVVGGEGFVPGSDVGYVNTYGMGGAYITASGAHAMVAPVHLPHGATVTRFQVFFEDNSTSDMTVRLDSEWLSSGGYSSLASVTSSGISGNGSRIDTTISGAVVDNTTFSYLVYAYCSAWDGANLKIRGALITYTLAEAP